MHKIITCIIRRVLLLTFACAMTACSLVKTGLALVQSREQFVATQTNASVRYEAGSEQVAERVARAMQQSVAIVEQSHGYKFDHAPVVYICKAACFTRFVPVGINEPAAQFGDAVFMNVDALLAREQRGYLPLEHILTHELAHLLLYQVGGAMVYGRVPAWFREGIAQQVANGAGGSEFCSRQEAVVNLVQGKHFDPDEAGSIFRNRTADAYGMTKPIFYHEALMFVNYLQQNNPAAYQQALHDIIGGKDFQDSFTSAYGLSLASQWPLFISFITQNPAQ